MLDPKAKEPLADEFERLVREYREPYPESTQQEAWNLIADFAVENADVIARRLSTVTPAEVGGLVERLRESAEELPTNSPAAINYREAATALEVKEAELVAMKTKADCWQAEFLNACRDAASFSDDLLRTEAALAEARKALEASASALDEAREDVEHWGSYAGEYFQNKHDLEGDLDRIAKQASAAHRVLTGGQEDG